MGRHISFMFMLWAPELSFTCYDKSPNMVPVGRKQTKDHTSKAGLTGPLVAPKIKERGVGLEVGSDEEEAFPTPAAGPCYLRPSSISRWPVGTSLELGGRHVPATDCTDVLDLKREEPAQLIYSCSNQAPSPAARRAPLTLGWPAAEAGAAAAGIPPSLAALVPVSEPALQSVACPLDRDPLRGSLGIVCPCSSALA